jgi:hypothetical protein
MDQQNDQTQNKLNIKNVQRDILQVEIRDPDKILFSGQANIVSSKNSIGPFDILPQHENFISLSDKITIYLDKHQKQEIQNTSAIVKAKLNKVNIFLGISSLIGKQQIAGKPEQPAVGQKPAPQARGSQSTTARAEKK